MEKSMKPNELFFFFFLKKSLVSLRKEAGIPIKMILLHRR